MALRILIVDDHSEFRALLRHHVSARWPEATVGEHDPLTQGPMPAGFTGKDYDLVLLDYQLGTAEDGFDYLRRFRTVKDFPPVIMLTASGNENLAVRAIKGGAADYIPKQNMTHDRLTGAIEGAIDAARQERHGSVTGQMTGAGQSVPADLAIEGYQLRRCLAQGGAGTVYLARELATGKDMVVKVMSRHLASGEESREAQRLQREYELIRKVDSPRIVRIQDFGVAAGHIYLTMEYFPGGSLRELLKGPLQRQQAMVYLRQIAQALELIHRAGILHRDLKPANIMLRRDGSLALIDFGTAKDVTVDSNLTQTGMVVGTPNYMSPEQCSGLDLSEASDLYSLGIIFYEMLTGVQPYTAATPLAVLYKHQYAPLPQLPPELSDLQPLFETLVAKAPEQRFPSARELLEALGNG